MNPTVRSAGIIHQSIGFDELIHPLLPHSQQCRWRQQSRLCGLQKTGVIFVKNQI
jgi:hypothetical protein